MANMIVTFSGLRNTMEIHIWMCYEDVPPGGCPVNNAGFFISLNLTL